MSSPASITTPVDVAKGIIHCYPSNQAMILTLKGTDITVDGQALNHTAETSPVEQRKPQTILHRKVSSKRLVGRLPIPSSSTNSASQSKVSLAVSQLQQGQQEGQSQVPGNEDTQTGQPTDAQQQNATKRHRLPSAAEAAVTGLLEQLRGWAHTERERQRARREKRAAKRIERRAPHGIGSPSAAAEGAEELGGHISPVSSGDEAEKAAMDAFDMILAAAEASNAAKRPSVQRIDSRKRSSRSKSLKGGHTSDTDYASDGEPMVPACEETLQMVEVVGIDEFKNQILKLAHTLRCKGWRRVSLDRYKEISVKRIGGALTNAVFMVSPPSELPPVISNQDPQSSAVSLVSVKTPARLLLRIYGPQASHLINRNTELSILRRLARKNIGPRLLGTFENGRFEEFFPSHPLTKEDIRIPETSRHIAKRLKELHEGIQLKEEERQKGPVAWLNWDKWAPRARGVMAIIEANDRKTGPIVGTSWEKFECAVEKYRAWLNKRCGGVEEVKKQLVFAHNDTQIGNILRLDAAGKSPLLLPMNEHRQLIVIDFEYANANTLGFEFANHFCEWMADYHNPDAPDVLHESHYPNLEQQRNFLRAYIEHSLAGAYSTRTPTSTSDSSSPYNFDAHTPASFNLDARIPVPAYMGEEAARQQTVEKEIDKLIEETLVWRATTHLMWCTWGIVQAKVKLDDTSQLKKSPEYRDNALSEEAKNEVDDLGDMKSEDGGGFDYLTYAQQRALLFWGDMLKLGVFKPEDVDGFVLENLKRIEW